MRPITFLSFICAAATAVHAADAGGASSTKPSGTNAWAEAELAIKRFRLPQGFHMEVFAVEPQLANPVALSVDEKGRVFVSETYRYRTSALDIRHYMSWYEDDLSLRTVNDRVAMMKRRLGPDAETKMTAESEQVRLLEDQNGDGRADRSNVFATGFNSMLDGIASGVLARRGDVYFANIPAVTLLRDRNNDGRAEYRKDLSYGYGVRFSLTGHDLHGLKFGPDGKLYFSVGDRGSHIVSQEGKTFAYPDEGVVYRCDPDGKNLEVFATGLRNPQELAFDEHGNLWTGDNNCDHGDSARLVYIVEGSDTGWRVGFQFSEQNPAGIWNSERLWHLRESNTAEYLIPPVAHISNGPSGLLYYPGTGFGDAYRGTFFLCDFRGQATGSGVHSFTVAPKGAGFTMQNPQQFLWDILLTDIDFGPDGKMYASDWVHGWPKSEKGRIYRLANEQGQQTPLVTETKKLINDGFAKRRERDLIKLLEHPDMRVRQEAQFTLADKKAVSALTTVARQNGNQLARLHAIWGLGQLAVKNNKSVNALLALAADADAEVRAQVLKVLGDARAEKAFEVIARGAADSSPRVRMFAGIALGKLRSPDAVQIAAGMLRANNNEDVYVRHGAIMALEGSGDATGVSALRSDASPAVRLGAALALRRMKATEVALFLGDADQKIVLEAARAINDAPIDRAMPELARYLNSSLSLTNQPLARRVANAAFRVGAPEHASALARFAAKPTSIEATRAEALLMLSQWGNPSNRDKVTGLWRPLQQREAKPAVDALKPVLNDILEGAPEAVRLAGIRAVEKLAMRDASPTLAKIVSDTQSPGNIRAQALKSLSVLKPDNFTQVLELATSDADESLRREAQRISAQSGGVAATGQLVSLLDKGTISEKQNALSVLSTVEGSVVDEVILQMLSQLTSGQLPKELELDVLDAAAARTDARIKRSLGTLTGAHGDNIIAEHKHTLFGGDAALGRKIFFERAEAACLRCHKVNGEGGEVGPDLTKIGQRDRDYLLEAIVAPNAKVAPGFESVIVTLKNGTSYAGVLKSENADTIEINSPEDGLIRVKKADVQERDRGLSGMPEGIQMILSKQDIRNLIEYLSSLK